MSDSKAHTPSQASTRQEKDSVKHSAVQEHRNWVSITGACNNGCVFCLDGDRGDRFHKDEKTVREAIERGFQPGARLILSGGEASIHPKFVDFVRFGKELNYNWIQTVSNGRMWSHRPFADAAVEAGLNEVTFSMHGHTPELHDMLTGVKGSFAQAVTGMRNLIGRIVVNVDVVINGLNYRHLDDILRFYQRLGVHEFDLLQIVPFGRAWKPEWREKLFYDLDEARDTLNRAFRNALKPGNFIWTNRFPVPYLEGVEELIQDPHKLHDELRGRRDEFEKLITSEKELECRDERCRFCFVQGYCDRLRDLLAMLRGEKRAGGLRANLSTKEGRRAFSKCGATLLKTADPLQLELVVDRAERLSEFFSSPVALPVTVQCREEREIGKVLDYQELFSSLALAVHDPSSIGKALALDVPLVFRVSRNTAAPLWNSRQEIHRHGRCTLDFPDFLTLEEEKGEGVNPSRYLKGWRDLDVRVTGAPPCLHPNAESARPESLDPQWLDDEGRPDLHAFADAYIRNHYLARSSRCDACRFSRKCRGLGINKIREYGFRILHPVNE